MAEFSGEIWPFPVGGFSTSPTLMYFLFNVTVPTVTNAVSKTWCDGQRIDIFWDYPAGTTQILIIRSQSSYCRFPDDPGVTVYSGPPINGYVDGPGPVPASYPAGTVQSTTPLEENQFYYYTIFVSFDAGSPYSWVWSQNAQIGGLSIKDYQSYYPYYLYNLLPSAYRRRDADPSRGTDQYLLRDYTMVIQCQVNIMRGWMEGLLQLRDPDNMPAGRIGQAENQTGILEAQSWDLGLLPEKSFDAGVLRRIAAGLIPITKEKGTCPGLVDLTKLFTTWNSTCDEAIEPECGVDRIFTLWDGVSKINEIVVTSSSSNPTISAGSLEFSTATLFMADGLTPDTIPGTNLGVGTVAFVQDAMGTFACVETVSARSGGNQTINFTSASALLRESITGVGTGAAGQFTIVSVDTSSYPWQFPSSGGFGPPEWGSNAWGGYYLKDSAGNVFPITFSQPTSSGLTVLEVTGTPASGAFTLAYAFDSGKNPLFNCRLYTGEFSFWLDPKWDIRLNNELSVGPWSVLVSLGAIQTTGYAPTPADVTIWVENVASVLGTSNAAPLPDTLADTTQAWTPHEWMGFYLLPNWDLTNIFPIVDNSATTVTVDIGLGGGLDTVSIDGSYYVILSEEDAVMYSRLVQLLPSFTPFESRPFVKFTGTS